MSGRSYRKEYSSIDHHAHHRCQCKKYITEDYSQDRGYWYGRRSYDLRDRFNRSYFTTIENTARHEPKRPLVDRFNRYYFRGNLPGDFDRRDLS